MDIELKTYTLDKLDKFIQSEFFKTLSDYPITKQRAYSYIHNPRASSSDRVMYLAFHKDQLVGYRLVLPDHIIHNSHKIKIGWYSCVWVNPENRGMGIAKKLVAESLKDWENKIILQGPVTESKNLYLGTGHFNYSTISGMRAYINLDLKTIVENKFPRLRMIQPVIGILDKALNRIRKRKVSKIYSSISLNSEQVIISDKLDPDLKDFFNKNPNNNTFQRGFHDYKWILEHPWIIETIDQDHISKNYHFSSISEVFKYKTIKLLGPSGQIEGVIITQIRDNHLSVHYSHTTPSTIEKGVNTLLKICQDYSINYLTSYDAELNSMLKEKTNPFLFTKKIKREFLYTKALQTYFDSTDKTVFAAGDGDMIFT